MCSLYSCRNALQFPVYRSFVSWFKFTLNYFIILDDIVNKIVFLISFSDCSLLVCRNCFIDRLSGLLSGTLVLILAVLGHHYCMQVFSSCGEQCLLSSYRARFSSCSAWTQQLWQIDLLCSMWDLPKSEIKPVSPTLAGGFFTTEPSGKPYFNSMNVNLSTCT